MSKSFLCFFNFFIFVGNFFDSSMTFHPLKDDSFLIFPRSGTLSFIDLVTCGLNAVFGIGIFRIGSYFNSGYLSIIILNMIIAIVSYYSLFLYVLSAAHYHQCTYEEIWVVAFSKKTVFIPAFCSIISYFIFFGLDTQWISKTVHQMISVWAPGLDKAFSNIWTLTLILLLVFYIPICFVNNLKIFVWIARIKLFCFFLILLYVFVRFILGLKNRGFDPNNTASAFKIDDKILTDLSGYVFSYELMPFAYPGMRHAAFPTIDKMKKMFLTVIAICFVYYILVGIFFYLTFYGQNSGYESIFSFYSNDWFNLCFMIIGILGIILSTPQLLNNDRYILLNAINRSEKFPKIFWFMVGVTIVLISSTIANLTGKINFIMNLISEVLALFLIFAFPPAFYLKAYGKSVKLHFIGSIFMLALGVIILGLILYHDISSFSE